MASFLRQIFFRTCGRIGNTSKKGSVTNDISLCSAKSKHPAAVDGPSKNPSVGPGNGPCDGRFLPQRRRCITGDAAFGAGFGLGLPGMAGGAGGLGRYAGVWAFLGCRPVAGDLLDRFCLGGCPFAGRSADQPGDAAFDPVHRDADGVGGRFGISAIGRGYNERLFVSDPGGPGWRCTLGL